MKYNEISDLYKFYTTILKGSRSWKQILFSKHSLDEVEYCRVKYNEWKQYTLEEFDKIEDKEHLKLWLKESKCKIIRRIVLPKKISHNNQ